MGVSLNGGTPKTPQNDHFLVGKPMVVGYHHFRKPPYISCCYRIWWSCLCPRNPPKLKIRTRNWRRFQRKPPIWIKQNRWIQRCPSVMWMGSIVWIYDMKEFKGYTLVYGCIRYAAGSFFFSRYVLLYVCGLSWRRSMFIGCDLCISWWCAFVIYKLLHVWFMWSPGDRVRSCFFTSYINVWTQSSGVNSWSLVEWELVEVSPSEVSPRLEMTNVFPKSVDVLGLNFGWWMVIDMLVWRLSHRVFLVALIVDDSWWECLEQKWCFQSCMPWAGTIMKITSFALCQFGCDSCSQTLKVAQEALIFAGEIQTFPSKTGF